jgi:hypothetical protein
LRRRDHWVRGLELVVAIVCWWNPLAWAVRRQIHWAEELCCDAWVRLAFPQDAKRYAETLLEAAGAVAVSPAGRPRLGSPLLRSIALKERIEMILQGRYKPSLSIGSKLALALAALVALPLAGRVTPELRAAERQAAPEAAAGGRAASEFPYAVHFEQGATRFLPGDEITILEVRGTAETFEPGHLYWIRGTYRLGSRDEAGLSAYTTAANAADGVSRPLRVQSVVVKRGEGSFTLFLPMTCQGWPHVSFYPRKRGESFGGNYFGTGESVLKQWWGAKAANAPQGAAAESELHGQALAMALGLKLMAIEPRPDQQATLGTFRGGLTVVEVDELAAGAAAARAGLKPGDVIVGLGQYETRTLANLAYAIEKMGHRPARLFLRRDGQTYTTELAPSD